tara:strand:- start:506 stop:661 length:156 start_codon:yes stop_codon:yes gene_type:complete
MRNRRAKLIPPKAIDIALACQPLFSSPVKGENLIFFALFQNPFVPKKVLTL